MLPRRSRTAVLFIGSWDSYFYALDAATGAEKWRYKTGEDPDNHNQQGIQSSAAVDGRHGLLRLPRRPPLCSRREDRRHEVVVQHQGILGASIRPRSAGGKVYFTTSDTGLLYAADAKTGEIKLLGELGMAHVLLAGHRGRHALHRLNRGHAQRRRPGGWQARPGRSPLMLRRNTAPTFAEKPTSLPFTRQFLRRHHGGLQQAAGLGPFLSSPVVVDNVIYIGSVDGNVYALN